MNNINCPCCNQNITQISNTILDNIRYPLNKSCVFCLCEMNSINNKDKLVSCPKCGNLYHNKCWYEYVAFKSKSNEPPINNVYNHFVFNPLLTPIRTEVNNLYMGSQFINPRSSYILYPIRL
jgi:hypothetical protein